MAKARKLESGKWFIEVCKKNADNGITVRKARSGYTKAEVVEWADDLKRSISDGSYWVTGTTDKTVADLLIQYRDRVSKHKRSAKAEGKRIQAFLNRETKLCSKLLQDVTKYDFVEWRDRRRDEVKTSTVNREFNLWSHVFSIAIDEFGWMTESPTKGVKRPKDPQPRFRRISDEEIETILYVCGYELEGAPLDKYQRIACAFLLAIETGMRSGDICKLELSDIHYSKRYLHVKMGKNGKPRDVPLSEEAIRILKQVEQCGFSPLFDFTDQQRDSWWREKRDKSGIKDLHFHDSKHEACTRLSRKVHVLALARMLGTEDLQKLKIYYNESAEEIAANL